MKRTTSTGFLVTAAVIVTALATACTMKNTEAPPLSGPSEFSQSIVVSVSPDVLTQDGGSQSVITVTARDINGQPLRNVTMRSEIFVDGVPIDFGSLSARNIVTGSDGKATLVYTAPAAPAASVDSGTVVSIVVTPVGTDFGNSTSRLATIRLVPPGKVVPPDGMQPAFTFTPTAPQDNQTVFFDASSSTSTAANPITGYAWDFGDGRTASGKTATHAFTRVDSYVVKLTVSDSFGRTATTSQIVNVGAGNAPVAEFVTSPDSPQVLQNVNFNASASRPGPGRTIRTYTWDFGDGETKNSGSPITTHDYVRSGTFTVTLVVTDDVGRIGSQTHSVVIFSDAPTADFTFSPTSPRVGQPTNFSAATSTPSEGRSITSYFWDFGNGTTSTNATPTATFGASGTFNVTLTVTDSAGKVGRVTKTVTVQ